MATILEDVFHAVKKGGVDLHKALSPLTESASEILNVDLKDTSVLRYYELSPEKLLMD